MCSLGKKLKFDNSCVCFCCGLSGCLYTEPHVLSGCLDSEPHVLRGCLDTEPNGLSDGWMGACVGLSVLGFVEPFGARGGFGK